MNGYHDDDDWHNGWGDTEWDEARRTSLDGVEKACLIFTGLCVLYWIGHMIAWYVRVH